jgi:2-methylisocitrate lyase-like PEP mutase family enzyme
MGAAVVAADAGADFLVLSETLSPDELVALCQLVSVPVYARGLALEEAWALGASGLMMVGTASGTGYR